MVFALLRAADRAEAAGAGKARYQSLAHLYSRCVIDDARPGHTRGCSVGVPGVVAAAHCLSRWFRAMDASHSARYTGRRCSTATITARSTYRSGRQTTTVSPLGIDMASLRWNSHSHAAWGVL